MEGRPALGMCEERPARLVAVGICICNPSSVISFVFCY
jgi:hypothetical protein